MHDAGETVDYHHGRRGQPRDPSICRDHASRPAVKEHPTLSRNQHSCPAGAAQADSPAGGSSVLPTSRETSERQRTWALAPAQSGSQRGRARWARETHQLERGLARSARPIPPRAGSRRQQAASRRIAGSAAAARERRRRPAGRVGSCQGEVPARPDRGGSEPRPAALPLLLDAAKQLEPLDVSLSRDAYLAALRAASVAGRLGPGMIEGGARASPGAARTGWRRSCAPWMSSSMDSRSRFTDGYGAGVRCSNVPLATLEQKEGERKEVSVRWPWFARFVATGEPRRECRFAPGGGAEGAWVCGVGSGAPWVPRVWRGGCQKRGGALSGLLDRPGR